MENYENPQVDEVLDVDAEEPAVDEEDDNAGPLDGLLKHIQESLKEADAKGFAETYAKAGATILQQVAAQLKEDNIIFTPEDVQFLDGYFIFAMGTNSVLHFHVKECPGWKFGIWFNTIETEDSTEECKKYKLDAITANFFTQYEDCIDKFKPSASTISTYEDHLEIEDLKCNWFFYNRIAETIKMIIKYPSIMWYRDVHYADLNYDYVTVEEADEEFTEWRLKENNKKLIHMENEKVMLDALKYIAGPVLESGEAFIADSGESCSPRYRLVLLNTGDPEEDGCYRIWDLGYEGAEEDKKYFEEKEKECEERAKDVWWFNPVSDCCSYMSKERFEKAKYYHEHPEEDDD